MKSSLSNKSPKPTSLFLFIDFQRVFEEGPHWRVPKFRQALENALKVHAHLDKELGDNLTTIATRYIPPDEAQYGGIWTDYFNRFPQISRYANNKSYDLANGIPTGCIISVPKFGKWSSIKSHLNNFRIDSIKTIYITGVSTECCILSTVMAAIDDGVKIVLIQDACAAGTDEDHNFSINILKGFEPNLEIRKTNNFIHSLRVKDENIRLFHKYPEKVEIENDETSIDADKIAEEIWETHECQHTNCGIVHKSKPDGGIYLDLKGEVVDPGAWCHWHDSGYLCKDHIVYMSHPGHHSGMPFSCCKNKDCFVAANKQGFSVHTE
jgi:nicotinamidase-related amidase